MCRIVRNRMFRKRLAAFTVVLAEGGANSVVALNVGKNDGMESVTSSPLSQARCRSTSMSGTAHRNAGSPTNATDWPSSSVNSMASAAGRRICRRRSSSGIRPVNP